MNIAFLSVVPSPYQRDLFTALHQHLGTNLQVYYLEDAAPDSPWPKVPLASWEHVLPGRTLGRGRVRCHLNWQLPSFEDADLVVINASLTDWTTQELMRRLSRASKPWVFWGERLRARTGVPGAIQSQLVKPLGDAAAIIAIGQGAQADFTRRLPGSQHQDIPYHCTIDPFLAIPERHCDKSGCTFLFCGQMIHRKGIDLLLKAFEKLPSDAKLVLAGRNDDLNALLSELDSETNSRIHYRGFVAPADLPDLFAEADVFVLPSRHEGWGVVINQALAAGRPVIATHAVGAAADLITSGREGLVIPPNDVHALHHAMMTLQQNPALRQRQATAARKRGAQLHPDVGASRWISLFEDLLQQQETVLAS